MDDVAHKDECVTVRVPARFAEMVQIDQFLATINEHAILTVTDPQGRIIYANDAFCRISQWDRSELIGQHYEAYSSGHHSASFYEDLWATLNAGSVWRGRVKNRAKDGSFYWIDAIVKPVRNQAGEITHIISIRSDITELVETQEALEHARQNEAAIRRILAICSSSIPVERMLGGALEVLSLIPWLAPIRRSAVFLVEPENNGMTLAAYRDLGVADTPPSEAKCFGACVCGQAASGRTVTIEPCAVETGAGDGAAASEHCAIPLISQGGLLGMLVLTAPAGRLQFVDRNSFLIDVAKALTVGIEQKRIQEGIKAEREEVIRKQQQLEEKTALMEAGFENMVEGLVALTPDLTILAANKRYAELQEIPPDLLQQGASFEPVIQHLERQGARNSRTNALSRDTLRQVVRSGAKKPLRFELESGRTLEIRVNPIPEVGAVFTVSDITDALLTEGRARQSQKLEALGELAGGVAHEYNNLLTSIQGFARMALKKFGDEERLREALSEIIEASGRATEITQQMLTFSTKRVLTPVVVDVGETVRAMEPTLRVFLQSKLEIRFDIKTKAYASIDPGLLTQCVSNLVTNSRQAMPDGGTITIACDTLSLDEPFTASHGDKLMPGRYVSISVSDTGVGIDPDVLNQIFDPFFTTQEVGAGTGLGLSMVFGMAKNQSGAVHVESTLGEGTTITIYLPEVDPPADRSAASIEAPGAATPPVRPIAGPAPARPEPPPAPAVEPVVEPAVEPAVVPTDADARNLMRFL